MPVDPNSPPVCAGCCCCCCCCWPKPPKVDPDDPNMALRVRGEGRGETTRGGERVTAARTSHGRDERAGRSQRCSPRHYTRAGSTRPEQQRRREERVAARPTSAPSPLARPKSEKMHSALRSDKHVYLHSDTRTALHKTVKTSPPSRPKSHIPLVASAVRLSTHTTALPSAGTAPRTSRSSHPTPSRSAAPGETKMKP